jgi:hypothetical protein
MKVASVAALAVMLVVLWPGAARAAKLSLRGFGTPVVDGVLLPGEWDTAERYDFVAARAPAEGGGTVPATLYVMNDSVNLYLALRVVVVDLGYSAFDVQFADPPPGPILEDGEDVLRMTPSAFQDFHLHFTPPFYYPWVLDEVDGGTSDGAGVARANGVFSVFEVAHPLNSADDRHDFSLTIPQRERFTASFQHCLDTCVGTLVPGGGFGEIVAVSGTHVPPETTITGGPRDGAEVHEEEVFEFSGTDDVAGPDMLAYQCRFDADEWGECESPVGGVTEDGWHTLRVRALDDMLNADPTPAQRRWRLDTKPPSKPKVRSQPASGVVVLRFSARDRGTPARRVRFRCAVDSTRLHACRARHRAHLPPGRHVVRVRAVDPAGNQSAKTARVVAR